MLSFKKVTSHWIIIMMLFFLSVVKQIGVTKAEKSSLACNSTNFNNSNVQSSQENVSCNNTGNETPETSEDEMQRDIFIRRIATAAVSGIGALLNLELLLVILVDPLKILRKGSWITILNLAVADLMSCISMFLQCTTIFLKMESLDTIASAFFLWGFGISASFMFLAFFSLQIFMVTKFPFKGPQIWTRTRVVVCCVVIWLLAVPLAYTYITFISDELADKMFHLLIAQVFVVVIIIIIQIVLKIFIVLEICKSRRDSGQSQGSKHRQIAKTVMILVVIQLLTILPNLVTRQVELFARLGMLSSHPLLWKFNYYHMPIAMLNFCANPVIYFLRLPDYKRTLLSLCGCGKCRIQRFPA